MPKKEETMFTILAKDGRARRGVLHTVHGDIQTPVFMNVGTCAAIKGGVSTVELANDVDCQVELSNTYHPHIRPGDKLCVEDRAGEHIVTAFCENWLASDKITRVLCEANGGYFPPAKVVGVVNVVTVRQEVVTKFENVPEEPEEKKGYEPWF